MNFSVQISAGEFYDKLTILKIKSEKIKNTHDLIWITKEYNLLLKMSNFSDIELKILCDKLYDINNILWDLENKVRNFEKQKKFDTHFIETARKIYKFNDQRALIKKQINLLTKSDLMEIKEHN